MKNDTPTPQPSQMAQVYDHMGQPYLADLVDGKKHRQLERELAASNEQLRIAALQLRAYSVNPERIGNTEIAMARVAQDQFATLRDELAASVQARRELMEVVQFSLMDWQRANKTLRENGHHGYEGQVEAHAQALAKHAQHKGDK